ncbi:MAG: hypothetical protein SNJ70_03965 [Armatimonadota bacterium]
MDYYKSIENWHIKASYEDYFSKYAFEYMAFIAYLRKIKYKDTVKDRPAIQKLKQDLDIKQRYLKIVEEEETIRNSLTIIKEELEKKPLQSDNIKWWNNSEDNIPRERINNNHGKINGLDDWENIVEFWYSIRNNFFHGGKNPDDNRDQLLIEHAFKTLSPLVNIFICENKQL